MSNTFGSHFGASCSTRSLGPPDRIKPDRLPRANDVDRGVERQDLRVHRQLAQAARDELRELRAEVENEDALMHEVQPLSSLRLAKKSVRNVAGKPTLVASKAEPSR